MKTFGYTMRNRIGALQRGSLRARDRQDALRQIKDMGGIPVAVTESKAPAAGMRTIWNPATWNRNTWLGVATGVVLIAALSVWLTADKKPAVRNTPVPPPIPNTTVQTPRAERPAPETKIPVATPARRPVHAVQPAATPLSTVNSASAIPQPPPTVPGAPVRLLLPSPQEEVEDVPDAPPPAIILRPSHIASMTPPTPSFSAAQIAEMEQRRQEIAQLKESGGDLKSYMQQVRERKAQEIADKNAAEQVAREQIQELAQKLTQDELLKRVREINLDLIVQGAKPVTDIELSPEEESVLVEYGVLAP